MKAFSSRARLVIAYSLFLQVLKAYHTWRTLEFNPVRKPLLPSDLYDTMAALVVPYGYHLTEHFVTTEDQYILRLFRLSTRHAEVEGGHLRPRPAVFLQHALMDSSAGWVIQGPQRSLGFILVDAGYDVWMGNSRGNTYSRNHTVLSPDDDDAFWAFSWDHMARHDVPAVVDYILEETKQRQLAYVGYSQGTTMALAALSTNVGLSSKISLAVLMAPVAVVTHMRSFLFVLGALSESDKLFRSWGWREWGARNLNPPEEGRLMQRVCRWAPETCVSYLTMLCGSNPQGNLDPALMAHLYEYLPAGTSIQNMAHWSQAVRQRDPYHMYHFDYGNECWATSDSQGPPHPGSLPGQPRMCNQRAYGQDQPPVYNLTMIRTKLALFTGGRDTLSGTEDIDILLRQLPQEVVGYHHREPDYAHLDFGLGIDAHVKVYPQVLDLLGTTVSNQRAEPMTSMADEY